MLAETCLAIAVWFEANNQPTKGKIAVAEVIHNRTQNPKYPNDYCSVIKQKNQFSFYKGSLKIPSHDKKGWESAVSVARNFSKSKTNYTKGALFFNHQRLGVRFNKTLKAHIGEHVFF